MADTPLALRIKAEFDARTQRKQDVAQQQAKESEDREKRLAQFGRTCDDLKAVWRPRFEEFAKQFGDRIKVTPAITPSLREAKIAFLTDMATMNLTISVAPSPDATKLVLDYDLLIIPIFFDYERHARLEMPLDRIDKAAVGKWVDDQLISCVKTYLTMQDNEIYIKRAMVEDPVTKVKLLREDARGKLELDGKTYYFSSEESLKKFRDERQPKPDAAKADAPKQAAAPTPVVPERKPTPTKG